MDLPGKILFCSPHFFFSPHEAQAKLELLSLLPLPLQFWHYRYEPLCLVLDFKILWFVVVVA